jgi:hypothetical protein
MPPQRSGPGYALIVFVVIAVMDMIFLVAGLALQ